MTSSDNSTDQVIVLLHAFPLSHELWSQLEPIRGYRFVTPDFPGFGTEPLAAPGLTLELVAQRLDRELKSQGVNKPFILTGISMGGYLAFEYYRQFSDQVDQLILISTRPGVDKPEGRQNRLNMAERVEKEGVRYLPEAMIPGLLGKTTLAEKPEVKDRLAKWIKNTSPHGVALAQRAMANRRDQTDLLGQIKSRTLILAGQEDALIAPTEALAMGQLIPKSQVQLIDQVGHLVPIESPKVFQKTLEVFLFS
ncbi:MAG TPA: alpha/beta hydrolase [bacterium]|jgi:3-oxoadipate enol-lactonase|nr:alpha/beta hydrolase [bacterium]